MDEHLGRRLADVAVVGSARGADGLFDATSLSSQTPLTAWIEAAAADDDERPWAADEEVPTGFARIIRVGDDDGWRWLIGEDLGGHTLHQRLRDDGALTPREVAQLGAWLAGGLSAQGTQSVPRGIGPERVNFDDNGAPWLAATPTEARVRPADVAWLLEHAWVGRPTEAPAVGLLRLAERAGVAAPPALEHILRRAQGAVPDEPIDDLPQLAELLQRWLTSLEPRPPSRSARWGRAAVVSVGSVVLLCAGVGIGGAWAVDRWQHPDPPHGPLPERPLEVAAPAPSPERPLPPDPPERPRVKPAPRPQPSSSTYDGVPLTVEQSTRLLDWLHRATDEQLLDAGVHPAARKVIVAQRPFADMASFADAPQIGAKTIEAVAAASQRE
jgi:hypothetical protein